jgi:serine O-acetyltransferase
LITHAFGVILFGKIGARFAVYGQGGTGGGFDVTDIGAGPGYPVIGDDVVFGIKAFALGAISVGDRVRVGPGALVVSDVPADAVVMPVPAKVLKVRIASSLTAEESESVAP